MAAVLNKIRGFFIAGGPLRPFAPGIRVKLSLFMGLFITLALVTATLFNYIHQGRILEEGFEREVEPLLKFINSVVIDMDNVKRNLVLIEDMRQRIREKERELGRYKRIVYRKKSSFMNSVRDLGRILGVKVRYEYAGTRVDTYYSVYLSDKDIINLEKTVRGKLRYRDGSPIAEADFRALLSGAGYVVSHSRSSAVIEENIRANGARIEEIKRSMPDDGDDAKKPALMEIKKIERENLALLKRASEMKRAVDYREAALNRLLKTYYEYHLRRMEEMGLYGGNIRILSLDLEGRVNYDTGDYMRESLIRFSPLLGGDEYKRDRTEFFASIGEALSGGEIYKRDYRIGSSRFYVEYIPGYKSPETYERLRLILNEIKNNPSMWGDFIRADYEIAAEIGALTGKLRERLSFLKERLIIPGRDAEYGRLYAQYRRLLVRRKSAFESYNPYKDEHKRIMDYYNTEIGNTQRQINASGRRLRELREIAGAKPEKEEAAIEMESLRSSIGEMEKRLSVLRTDLAESRNDISRSGKLSSADAFLFLREAALFDYMRLKHGNEPLAYRDYLASNRRRSVEWKRWETARSWIMRGESETGIPGALPGFRGEKTIDNGIQTRGRSEAEEYMWKVDGTPLASEIGWFGYDIGSNGLIYELLQDSVIGYNAVHVDTTDGGRKIAGNRRIMLAYAAGVALLSAFTAFFFASFMVRRVRAIIAGAVKAGDGDLNVSFPEKGLDEIEDLGSSLNVMMKGLREREEMKGELAAAGEIQKGLLPEKIPSTLEGHYTICAFYKPMQGVGGDYYDFIEIDESKLIFCIGDVSNHGVGPAIVMASTRAQLHGIIRRGERDLVKILLELNDRLYFETPAHIYVTFFVGVIDRGANEIRYCSAGHIRPVVYRYRNDALEFLDGGGLPLGMDDSGLFAETLEPKKIVMQRGDVFFQYTDGLSEAMNETRVQYGEERLYAEVQKWSRKKVEVLIDRIARSVEEFTGKSLLDTGISELNDDLAMLVFKRIS